MSIAATRLTGSTTPSHEEPTHTHTHNTRSTSKKNVTFSPESKFRIDSPTSLSEKYQFSIITGARFESDPNVRQLFSPTTLANIEKERQNSQTKENRAGSLSHNKALRAIYTRPQLNNKQTQDSNTQLIWFPLLVLGVATFLYLGAKYGGATSDQREG